MFRFGLPTQRNKEKEMAQSLKMAESQSAMLQAAVSTAIAAQDLTTVLKNRLDDVVNQFENTARILRDGLVICNEDGTIISFNPAAERIFGVKSGVILQKNVLNIFEGAYNKISDANELWSLLQNDDSNDVLGKRNGSTFPATITCSVLTRHDSSRVVLLLVHENLRTNRFQNIFEESVDGIIVLTESGMQAMNPSIGKIFGYSAYELINKSFLDIISPVDKDRFVDLLSDGKIIPKTFAMDGIHSDGSIVNLTMSLTEIEWEENKAILITIKDVTEIHKLECQIAAKRDNGVDLICSFDANFRIVFANKTFREMMKSKNKLIVGSDIRDLMSDEDRAIFMKNASIIQPNKNYARMKTIEDGKVIDWVDHALFDSDHKIIEYHRVGRDIS